MSTVGRRENLHQDRGLQIVDSRPLGLERRTVQALQAPHRTLQAPHRRQQTTFWRKAWQIYRPPFGIHSLKLPFPSLTPWGIYTSQTHRPPIQLWKISWYRWASGGLVVVDMESVGCTNFDQFMFCIKAILQDQENTR